MDEQAIEFALARFLNHLDPYICKEKYMPQTLFVSNSDRLVFETREEKKIISCNSSYVACSFPRISVLSGGIRERLIIRISLLHPLPSLPLSHSPTLSLIHTRVQLTHTHAQKCTPAPPTSGSLSLMLKFWSECLLSLSPPRMYLLFLLPLPSFLKLSCYLSSVLYIISSIKICWSTNLLIIVNLGSLYCTPVICTSTRLLKHAF